MDSPPKLASWRTSFVGPSIVFTCQSCLCKSLWPSPSPIVSNIIMERYGFQITISIQAMRKSWRPGQEGGLSIGQLARCPKDNHQIAVSEVKRLDSRPWQGCLSLLVLLCCFCIFVCLVLNHYSPWHDAMRFSYFYLVHLTYCKLCYSCYKIQT